MAGNTESDEGGRSLDLQSGLIAIVILLLGVCLILLSNEISARSGGEVLREAGFVIVGTVLVTFVYEFVLRRSHDKYMEEMIANSLVTKGPKYGITSVKTRMDFPGIFDQLKDGDVLLWLDTYCPDAPNYQEHLLSAIQRGAAVDMLAIRPDSEPARLRAAEIKSSFAYSFPRFRDEARIQIDKLREALQGSTPEVARRVRLRLYDDLPCIPMYILVRGSRPMVGYTSFFLGYPTFKEPHLEWTITAEGFLYKFYDYFVEKWGAHADDEVDLVNAALKPPA
jgi:hypothetical protein